MRKQIILSEVEKRIVNYKAKKAQQFYKDDKLECQKGIQKYLNGFGAELAFCQLMNVYPALLLEDLSRIGDVIINGNLKVDVKCTEYRNGKLKVMEKREKKPCDIYVLMIGRFPVFKYIGFVFRSELIKEKNLENDGYASNSYSLKQGELRPFLPIYEKRKK